MSRIIQTNKEFFKTKDKFISLCVQVLYMMRLRDLPEGKGKQHLKFCILAFCPRMGKWTTEKYIYTAVS